MTYIKVNDSLYEATIEGRMRDFEWDDRDSKAITTSELTYAEAVELFRDGVAWSIIDGDQEWDNSEYSVAGDITDHRDGSITIKMGKPTDLELAYEELYG